MIFRRLMYVPMIIPRRPIENTKTFLTAMIPHGPKSPKWERSVKIVRQRVLFPNKIRNSLPDCHLVAVSTRTGAMMASVDIFTAPKRATKRSSQGTVAASATENEDFFSQFTTLSY